MLSIDCREVTKRFDRVDVLERISWQIGAGQVVGLLGGSGAGKTTLLKLIAGLARCTSGRIVIDVPQKAQRRIGMVFQNLALWPHLTALEHLTCVLFRYSSAERRRRAEALLGELRLPPAAWHHRPGQLSGGEAQRLALARALAIEPHILLLDEPLAQLDPPLRSDMLDLIRTCVVSRRTTCLFVTHSWDEAALFCHRIAVLDAGRLVQDGTPADLYWHPASDVVAQWTGPVTPLHVTWLRQGYIAAADHALSPPAPETILVRPQQLAVVDASEHNRWTIIECQPRGAGWWTTVAHDSERLSLLLPRPAQPGDIIGLELRSSKALVKP